MTGNLTMSLPHGARTNRLLAKLSLADFLPLADHLERVTLRLGDVIHEPGQRLLHAYFPTTAVVSLHCLMESGASSEMAGIGNEGMVGIALIMGADITTSSAAVQIAGEAYRLDASVFKDEFHKLGPLHRLMLLYAQILITQLGQSVACNRHHSIEQQLCRWFLLTLDRLGTAEFVMTQDLVANTLGVRRESITAAATKLQQAGVIHYRRGHISVLDRERLETRACECYAAVKDETSRLMLVDLGQCGATCARLEQE